MARIRFKRNKDERFDLVAHRLKSPNIIINYPGLNGTIDGYNRKYEKIADFLVEKNIGAVVRAGNPVQDNYEHAVVENLRNIIDITLMQSDRIAGTETPNLYVMGTSAGASALAYLAHEYSEIEKVLLVAPSGNAGKDVFSNILSYEGELAVLVGEEDKVIPVEFAKRFYDMAFSAQKRQFEVIPGCDHQFKGETNGKILSKAPLWAFASDTLDPDDGKILY